MSVVDAAIALYHAEGTKSTISIAMAENDLRQVTQALIFSCSQCNTDRHVCPGCGESIGHFEALCGRCEDDSTALQHETPEESAAIVDANLRAAGSSGLAQGPVELEPEWMPAEWQHVLAGDRVRLGAQEADVTRSSVGAWHVDNTDRYRPRPWEHTEVSISLAHLDRPLVMAPGGPVEILADRERAAVLVLQKAFPLVTA